MFVNMLFHFHFSSYARNGPGVNKNLLLIRLSVSDGQKTDSSKVVSFIGIIITTSTTDVIPGVMGFDRGRCCCCCCL